MGPPQRPERSALPFGCRRACLACPADSHYLWPCRSELKDTLLFTGAYETLADGKAAEHAAPARREAAKKLIMNHERVLHDLTRTAARRDRTWGLPVAGPSLAAARPAQRASLAVGGSAHARTEPAHTRLSPSTSPFSFLPLPPPGTDGPPKSQPELTHGLVLMAQVSK